MNRTCPDCGCYTPPQALLCGCGRKLRSAPSPSRFPIYLAVLPLIVPAFFMFHAIRSSFSTADTPRPHTCVVTDSVTLRQGTALNGAARNRCDETLKKVILHMAVQDDHGTAAAGDYEIPELKPGDTREFERAWTIKVATWQITANQ